MSKSLGDFDATTVVYGKFTTYRPSTGAPYTLAGTPALSVYKDNSTTQSTTGVTLTADFDSVTGFNHYAIDTSTDGTFYSAGSFFDVVVTTGTVDSISAVGTVVGSFTIRKTSALKPATSGRTLVVDANGLADANAVKLGPTGSGTAQTARDIGASVLLSTGTGTGQLDFTSGVVKANATQFAAQTITAAAGVTIPSSIASPTNITAGTITTTTNLTTNNDKTGYGLSSAAVQAIWDALTSALTTASSIGKLLVDNINATISSRLATSGYTAPLDAAGTRSAVGLASANLDTQLSGINSKTTNLPAAPADETLVIAATNAIMARLGAPAGASMSADVAAVKVDTAATKTKTDSLTFTVAGQVDSNIQYVNDVAVTGNGQVGTEWGP